MCSSTQLFSSCTQCVGTATHFKPIPKGGIVKQVAAQTYASTCYLFFNGTIVCRGLQANINTVPAGNFSYVSCGSDMCCAIYTINQAITWLVAASLCATSHMPILLVLCKWSLIVCVVLYAAGAR